MAGNWPNSEEAFIKWFYERQNGNRLLRRLNQYAYDYDQDHVRREILQPCIYGVVHNGISIYDNDGLEWKYMKVGFTQRQIGRGTNNRMEQVMREITNAIGGQASTIFVLPISCVDTSAYRATEERIRGRVGHQVLEAKARDLNMPYPSEWVFTSQAHIDNIRKMKNASKNGVLADRIDIFRRTINGQNNNYYIGTNPKVPPELLDRIQ